MHGSDSSLSLSHSVCLSVHPSVSPQLYCSFQSNKPHLWKDCKVLIVIISLCVCVCLCGWGPVEPQNLLDTCQNVWWPHLVSDSTDVVSSAERLQSCTLVGKTWLLQRNEGGKKHWKRKTICSLSVLLQEKKKKPKTGEMSSGAAGGTCTRDSPASTCLQTWWFFCRVPDFQNCFCSRNVMLFIQQGVCAVLGTSYCCRGGRFY